MTANTTLSHYSACCCSILTWAVLKRGCFEEGTIAHVRQALEIVAIDAFKSLQLVLLERINVCGSGHVWTKRVLLALPSSPGGVIRSAIIAGQSKERLDWCDSMLFGLHMLYPLPLPINTATSARLKLGHLCASAAATAKHTAAVAGVPSRRASA